jgi:hypothetical protein
MLRPTKDCNDRKKKKKKKEEEEEEEEEEVPVRSSSLTETHIANVTIHAPRPLSRHIRTVRCVIMSLAHTPKLW